VEPTGATGRIEFRDVKRDNVRYGNLDLNVTTENNVLHAILSGELDKVPLHGTAEARLVAGTPMKGEVRFDRISMATLHALAARRRLLPWMARSKAAFASRVRFESPIACTRPSKSNSFRSLREQKRAHRISRWQIRGRSLSRLPAASRE